MRILRINCRGWFFLAILIFLASACAPLSAATDVLPSDTTATDWYTVYFSQPGSGTLRGGPDAALAAAIDAARASVDAAIYDLNLWSIRDALLAAQRRGVTVRIVTESDNLDRPELQELIAAGIEVLGDRREALMHNKFVVIDRYEVWSGSMNLTLNGAYRNDNNLIRLRSSRLAEDFLVEFEEMFIDDQFGAYSPANTPNPVVTVEGTQVEVYFSPDDGAAARIVALIDGAEESVYFLAFSFTSDEIAQAMQRAEQRGVSVAGVFETGQATNDGGEFFRMADAGMDVRLDGNPDNMHHKVIIIDGRIVITGSYNFSRSAEERNDENLLVIDNSQIANLYLDEFNRIYADGQ